MEQLREETVKEARKHLGTPFIPQGRLIGVGVDCVGLVFSVANILNFKLNDVIAYSQSPNNGLFEKHANEQLIKINYEDLKKGDLLVFKFIKEAQHIAFVSEVDNNIRIIHAYTQVGKVVEHDIDKVWHKRIVGCYRFKELEE